MIFPSPTRVRLCVWKNWRSESWWSVIKFVVQIACLSHAAEWWIFVLTNLIQFMCEFVIISYFFLYFLYTNFWFCLKLNKKKSEKKKIKGNCSCHELVAFELWLCSFVLMRVPHPNNIFVLFSCHHNKNFV